MTASGEESLFVMNYVGDIRFIEQLVADQSPEITVLFIRLAKTESIALESGFQFNFRLDVPVLVFARSRALGGWIQTYSYLI